MSQTTKERQKLWYLKNRERILNKRNSTYIKKGRPKKTYLSSDEYIKEYRAKWRTDNKEKISEYNRSLKDLKGYKQYKANNEAKRRAIKLKAFVGWSNSEKIKDIYMNCPKGYHVDHIIPLQNKNVCGLHVENNLQYLPALDNLKKNNKFEVA